MKVIIVVACLIAVTLGREIASNIELPSFLHICKLNDPKRNECIKESIKTILPASRGKSQNGIKLPQIDPFVSDSVTFNFKNNEFFNGDFHLRNIKSFGLSSAKVQSVKSNFKEGNMKLQVEIVVPKMLTSANYNANMKIRSLEFPSKGDFNITMKEITAKWNIRGIIENINGEGYMKIFQAEIVPTDITDMDISVSGVFPDESLNKIANTFFNQYWRLLYKDMLNETTKQWEPIMLQTLNEFFSQIPFRRLLITK